MRDKVSMPYEIQVAGHLGQRWDGRTYGDLRIQRTLDGVTTLLVCVPDSAALRGLINHLWDLNLEILSLRLIPAYGDTDKEKSDEN